MFPQPSRVIDGHGPLGNEYDHGIRGGVSFASVVWKTAATENTRCNYGCFEALVAVWLFSVPSHRYPSDAQAGADRPWDTTG